MGQQLMPTTNDAIEREFRNQRTAPPGVPVCRECGCWQEDACWNDDIGPCEWIEPDLCGFCCTPADSPSSSTTAGLRP